MVSLALSAFCQKTKNVKLDSLVSVTLPADYHKLDTLGQQTYTARSEYGYIIISRQPNPPGNKTLKNEKDLNKVFKEYIRKVQGSLTEGTIVDDHDTVIKNIEVRDFTLRTDTGSGVQLRQFRVLYTKPTTYSFQYLYDEARKDVAKKEITAFFKSIIIAPGFNGTDQFLTFGNSQGISTKALVIIIVAVLLLVCVILVVRKKRRKDILLNDILKQ